MSLDMEAEFAAILQNFRKSETESSSPSYAVEINISSEKSLKWRG